MQLGSRVLSLAGWRLYTLSVCLSSFFITYISLLFSVRYHTPITLQAAPMPKLLSTLDTPPLGGTSALGRTRLPATAATNLRIVAGDRHLRGALDRQATTSSHSRCLEAEFSC